MRGRKYFPDTVRGILLLGNTGVVSSLKKKKKVINIQYREELKVLKLLPEAINSG